MNQNETSDILIKTKKLTDEQRELVEKHKNMIHTFFKDHPVPDNIEDYKDLVSDMCVTLCHAAMAYNPEKNVQFTTFAWDCMENALRDIKKAERAKKRIPEEKIYSLNEMKKDYDSDSEEEYGDLLAAADNTEDSALFSLALDECKKQLNERESLIIQLFMQGYSIEEIAKILDCTESYVYKTKTKFVKYIKETFC